MKRSAITSLLTVIFLFLLAGCKPTVPGKYLSPKKMENLLYDLHRADALASTRDDFSDTLLPHVYRAMVLKKHGVTEAELDSSMVYYMRHSDRMFEIYQHLADRLSGEESSVTAVPTMAANPNDTTGRQLLFAVPSVVLYEKEGFSNYSLQVDADSTFRPGDQVMLSFRSDFIYQEGSRNATALLLVRFKNDSVATTFNHITMSMPYQLTIADPQHAGIKQVKAYMQLNHSLMAEQKTFTTLKLLHISNLQLTKQSFGKPMDSTSNAPINK